MLYMVILVTRCDKMEPNVWENWLLSFQVAMYFSHFILIKKKIRFELSDHKIISLDFPLISLHTVNFCIRIIVKILTLTHDTHQC